MSLTFEGQLIETLLIIADKDGNDVPFILNQAQRQVDEEFTGREIIPKARQRGVSSYYLARGLVKCLSQRNTRAVVISHEDKATQRMLAKVHYMIDHIRGPRPITKNLSSNQITFPKMDSMFYIGTAGAKKFGRGDTITFLHGSEVAYWPDPKSLLSGLFQAVPESGEIGLESTGKGVGNYYHRACTRAAEGDGRFRLCFLSWLEEEGYRRELSPLQAVQFRESLREDLEEIKLFNEGVDLEQLAFRREKLEEMDYDLTLFKQEYPMTLDECFQASGRSIFRSYFFFDTPKWQKQENGLFLLEGHPYPEYGYVIGADVAAGVGGSSSEENIKKENEGDRSVAEIICLDTMEQVGEYASNRIEPDSFGDRLVELGKIFNLAFIVVEANNHGIMTLYKLRKKYPKSRIYRRTNARSKNNDTDRLEGYGHRTTSSTKPLMIGDLRRSLREDLVIHSPLLVSELSTFVETETLALEAEEGCFDDRVIAMALAVRGLPRAGLSEAQRKRTYHRVEIEADPFSFDSLYAELVKRNETFHEDPFNSRSDLLPLHTEFWNL